MRSTKESWDDSPYLSPFLRGKTVSEILEKEHFYLFSALPRTIWRYGEKSNDFYRRSLGRIKLPIGLFDVFPTIAKKNENKDDMSSHSVIIILVKSTASTNQSIFYREGSPESPGEESPEFLR